MRENTLTWPSRCMVIIGIAIIGLFLMAGLGAGTIFLKFGVLSIGVLLILGAVWIARFRKSHTDELLEHLIGLAVIGILTIILGLGLLFAHS